MRSFGQDYKYFRENFIQNSDENQVIDDFNDSDDRNVIDFSKTNKHKKNKSSEKVKVYHRFGYHR